MKYIPRDELIKPEYIYRKGFKILGIQLVKKGFFDKIYSYVIDDNTVKSMGLFNIGKVVFEKPSACVESSITTSTFGNKDLIPLRHFDSYDDAVDYCNEKNKENDN
jgi:hypothetical protein